MSEQLNRDHTREVVTDIVLVCKTLGVHATDTRLVYDRSLTGQGGRSSSGGALAVSSVTDYSHQPARVRSKAKIKPLTWP